MCLKIDVMERECKKIEFGKEVRPCLDASKFQKFYKISRHIESLDACMKH
jgi:hypothetical protein